MRLRLAQESDAEAIRAIYNHEVINGVRTFDMVPRGASEQAEWMVRHQGSHPALVAVVDEGESEVVVGFGALSPYRDRPAYATTVEDSVYIDHRYRGQGIGRALLEELLELATNHGFHTVIARIVADNEASVLLHERCGFFLVGVEKEVGRKHGRWLDLIELQRML